MTTACAAASAMFLILPSTTIAQPAKAMEPSPAVAACDKLAFAMLDRHAGKSGNLFFSPVSLAAALGMAHSGAAGTTLDEMSTVLGLPTATDASAESFNKLLFALTAMQGGKSGVELTIADALWANKGIDFLPAFAQRVSQSFQGESRTLDFSKSGGESARKTINKWVSKQTRKHIPELLPSGSITPDSQVIITNAVYFLGKWKTPFRTSSTYDASFTMADGRKVPARLMNQQAKFGYIESEGFKALSMPYGETPLEFVALLPDEVTGLATLERSLSTEMINRVTRALHRRDVNVTLPRFKMRWKSEVSEDLRQSGLKISLSDQADFSEMTSSRRLKIAKVFHEATVEVDEAGTVATAATGLEMAVTSARPNPPVEFRADHAFLFFIRDSKSGAILFVGRVADPNAG